MFDFFSNHAIIPTMSETTDQQQFDNQELDRDVIDEEPDTTTEPVESGPPDQQLTASDEAPLEGDLSEIECINALAPEQASPEALTHEDSAVTTEAAVEAILMATDAPIPANKIAQILGVGNAKDVRKHVKALNEHYTQTSRSFRIEEIAKGFQILTLPEYNPWVSKIMRIRSESKLSPAAMETLAIIAYKQPILRAEVEAIRGVAGGEVINRLREMHLVKIVGRAEEIGRPMLYGTTPKFLEVFGLASLEDLPNVEELTMPGSN